MHSAEWVLETSKLYSYVLEVFSPRSAIHELGDLGAHIFEPQLSKSDSTSTEHLQCVHSYMGRRDMRLRKDPCPPKAGILLGLTPANNFRGNLSLLDEEFWWQRMEEYEALE